MKSEVKLVELVSGMGIFLRADKLSLAIEKSKEIPTRLLRTLMDMFFTPEVMAGSTAKGSLKRGLDALDPQTMEALYRFVIAKHPGKTIYKELVNEANDKCYSYRRKQKQSK
ncbi:uncharacterized protein LOC144645779 [Oculina patagonica]